MTYSEGDACRWCDVDHDLISPGSKSESLETALMDNHTVSCLCSSEIGFISRLYMDVKKKKKTTLSSCGGNQPDWYLSKCSTLFCSECWDMFQNPMNINKHGIALKGQTGLCFADSALCSEWQCLTTSPVLGDYQRQNGVYLSAVDICSHYLVNSQSFQTLSIISVFFSVVSILSCILDTYVFESKAQKVCVWLGVWVCMEIENSGFSIHSDTI